MGLVTRGNFYGQLGGNQLQCTLQDHFFSPWVIFQIMCYDPEEKHVNIQMWTPSLLWEFLELVDCMGLVTRGNFYGQLGGNQLQCTLQDHFFSTWVIFQIMCYDPEEKHVNIQMWTPSLLGEFLELVACKLPRVTWPYEFVRKINAQLMSSDM